MKFLSTEIRRVDPKVPTDQLVIWMEGKERPIDPTMTVGAVALSFYKGHWPPARKAALPRLFYGTGNVRVKTSKKAFFHSLWRQRQ